LNKLVATLTKLTDHQGNNFVFHFHSTHVYLDALSVCDNNSHNNNIGHCHSIHLIQNTILTCSTSQIKWINYSRLHLSVNTWRRNMLQLGVKRGMIGHHTFEVQQTVTRTFTFWKTLKVLLLPIFHGYTRSKTTFAKGLCILTQVRVNFSEEVFDVQSFCHFMCWILSTKVRATVC